MKLFKGSVRRKHLTAEVVNEGGSFVPALLLSYHSSERFREKSHTAFTVIHSSDSPSPVAKRV